MESTRKTILFIGDQTDPWVDSIDYITKNATQTPWIRSFMRDLCHTVKAELSDMEPEVSESLGNFQSLQELAERYRGVGDETGVANAILIHAVRAVMLLQYVYLLLRPNRYTSHLGHNSSDIFQVYKTRTAPSDKTEST